jgi:hypothetical protein
MFTGSRCPNRIPIQSITQLPSYKETSSLKVAVENKFDIQHHNCLNSNHFLKFISVYLKDLTLSSAKNKVRETYKARIFLVNFGSPKNCEWYELLAKYYMLHDYLSSTFLTVWIKVYTSANKLLKSVRKMLVSDSNTKYVNTKCFIK